MSNPNDCTVEITHWLCPWVFFHCCYSCFYSTVFFPLVFSLGLKCPRDLELLNYFMFYTLILSVCLITALLFILTPAFTNNKGFYQGHSRNGAPPSLMTLVFSQVTTWIFARSLMNAAILGFYYGLWGVLAYATYYLSFLTGGLIAVSYTHLTLPTTPYV